MSVSIDNKRFIKGVAIGVLISAALCAVLMCICALILNMISGIPYGVIDYLMIGVQGVSVLIGAYIASAIAKSRGLIAGLLCGAVVFLLSLAFGLSNGNSVSILTAIRAAVLMILGALGGIKGVNRKEKIRIR